MYAILLNEQQHLDLEKTATILAKAENLVYGDATRAVRTCTGILAANLPAHEAEAISNELNANGVACFVLAMADFYHPPDAQNLSNMDLSPEAFGLIDLYGRVAPVPWGSIVLLSLGHIGEQRRERHSLGDYSLEEKAGGWSAYGAVRMARFGGSEPDRKALKLGAKYVLDVFASGPNEGHWRIEHNAVNYRCLGSRVTQRSEENFRLVVEEMVRHATACYGNRGLNAFLENAPEKTYAYGGIRHFDEENLWLLQKIYLNLRAQ